MHRHSTLARVGRALLLGLVALGAVMPAASAVAATRYVFAVFKGDSAASEKLSIYTSTDGLNFKLLSDTGYGGPTGVLRDPTIMKHSDGKYYVAHTIQSWDTNSSAFAIAYSTDLLKWTNLTTVDAQVPNVAHTWAPEWFKDSDGSINLIVSIDVTTASSSFRAYKFTATDDTLTKWSAPTAIGIGPNNIDTFIVKAGATYHAFSKNESTKYIEHATATGLTGPWTWVGKDDWAGWGSGKEGPALFQLDSGEWRIIMDRYSGGGCLYGTSSDLNKWSGVTEIPGGLSGVVRHGTVLREEDLPDGGAGDVGSDVGKDVAADTSNTRPDGSGQDGTATGGASGTGGRGSGGASGSAGSPGTGGAGTGVTGTGGLRGSGGGPGSGGASGRTGGSGGSSLVGTGGTGRGGAGGSGGATGAGGVPGAGGTSAGGSPGSGGSGGSSSALTGTAVVERRDASGSGGGQANEGGKGCTCSLGSAAPRHPPVLFFVLLMGALAILRRRR